MRVPGDKVAFWAGGACVLLAAIVLFGSGAAPLLGDYAEWTYHGVLLRDVLQGHADAGYVLKNYPVPNSLTTAGLGVLMLALPWEMAAKVWLLLEVLLGAICVNALVRAAARGQAWQTLVTTGAVLLGIAFWAGFTNFLLGTYLSMLLCALLLRGFESRWAYGGLLIAAFFSHMIPFGFGLAAMGLYLWQHRRWSLAWQAVPSLGLTAWYFAGRLLHGNADGQAGMVASVAYMTPMFAVFKANSYLKCWGFINPALNQTDSILLRMLGAKLFMMLFALNLLVAVSAFTMMAGAAWRSVRFGREERFFWIAVAIFFVGSLLMPGAAAGISDPGGRMMQVAMWSGVCLVTTRHRWQGVLLAACGAVLLATNLYLVATVAMKPPTQGEMAGSLPATLRQFGHVYYADRAGVYGQFEAGRMDLDIYPTAMFLRKETQRQSPR